MELKYHGETCTIGGSEVEHSLAAPHGSAWERVNEVFAEADKLEELTKLRMERPGETRESAFEWAKEMYQRYPPSNK